MHIRAGLCRHYHVGKLSDKIWLDQSWVRAKTAAGSHELLRNKIPVHFTREYDQASIDMWMYDFDVYKLLLY